MILYRVLVESYCEDKLMSVFFQVLSKSLLLRSAGRSAGRSSGRTEETPEEILEEVSEEIPEVILKKLHE